MFHYMDIAVVCVNIDTVIPVKIKEKSKNPIRFVYIPPQDFYDSVNQVHAPLYVQLLED